MILLTHVLVVHHHPPRFVSRITGWLFCLLCLLGHNNCNCGDRYCYYPHHHPHVLHCVQSNGVLSPNEIIAFCMWTDSECMHIPTEGPCTFRVQLHCNNNNEIVINGHFFVSGISIRYISALCVMLSLCYCRFNALLFIMRF